MVLADLTEFGYGLISYINISKSTEENYAQRYSENFTKLL